MVQLQGTGRSQLEGLEERGHLRRLTLSCCLVEVFTVRRGLPPPISESQRLRASLVHVEVQRQPSQKVVLQTPAPVSICPDTAAICQRTLGVFSTKGDRERLGREHVWLIVKLSPYRPRKGLPSIFPAAF